MTVRVGQAGLGEWGKNLARNFGDLTELTWLRDPANGKHEEFQARYPYARWAESFDEMLGDPELDAVVIATPVPTHFDLAKQALEAGKHVFVEKPPAMTGAEIDELAAIAQTATSYSCPGTCCSTTRVQKLKEPRRLGGSARCSASTATARTSAASARTRTRLVARRTRPLRDPVPARRGSGRGDRARRDFLQPGVEDVVFCYLRFPSGRIAHMHLSWLDPHKMSGR